MVPNKTFRIELPNLGGRELDLAFLLGFFDGDGKQGLTVLRSGNARFLEQIKTISLTVFIRVDLSHHVLLILKV